ncbi:MAG: hypothetical protein QNJ70_15730 [Xenococcaceae cyanobacterium MO_207.B15]|nr:hypothetical protein [Xenococcaceae cyanobacterium MO_207.B15]
MRNNYRFYLRQATDGGLGVGELGKKRYKDLSQLIVELVKNPWDEWHGTIITGDR